MIGFIKKLFSHFFASNTFQKGAALGFYAVFSIIPMIMIVVLVFGFFFGRQIISGEIYDLLKNVFGDQVATQIQSLVKNHYKAKHNGLMSAIIGFLTLALSASGMFNQIHNAFNSIWNIKEKPRNSIIKYLVKHLTSFVLIILLFSFIFLTTVISGFISKFASHLPAQFAFIAVYDHLVSFIVMSIIFATMFLSLGDARIHWKPLLLAGLFTSLLFSLGKVGVSMYIKHMHLASAFGSASTLAVLMMWVYYISQIIFLGASFVKVMSDELGYKILPNKYGTLLKVVEVA